MSKFRAAYIVSADRQGDVVLTGPEHAALSDEALLAEAKAEMARAGIDLADGTLEIGEWEDGEADAA